MPEFNHNEIVGWMKPEEELLPILLQCASECMNSIPESTNATLGRMVFIYKVPLERKEQNRMPPKALILGITSHIIWLRSEVLTP